MTFCLSSFHRQDNCGQIVLIENEFDEFSSCKHIEGCQDRMYLWICCNMVHGWHEGLGHSVHYFQSWFGRSELVER